MKRRICVSIPVKDHHSLFGNIGKAENQKANLIEVRLDYIEPEECNAELLGELVKETSIPLIATNRKYEEGGYRAQEERNRIQTLIKAAEMGFKYVDIELQTNNIRSIIERVVNFGARTIVSHHLFDTTPSIEEMTEIVTRQIETNCNICKLVTTAKSIEDNIKCLIFTRDMSRVTETVCFAMGRKGVFSRVLSPIFGACFTYASLQKGLETASGQISIDDLRNLYESLGV